MNVYASKARAAYLQNELKSLSPELLVVRLYQELGFRLRAALQEEKAQGAGGKRAEHLAWALALTLELQASLDFAQGGELSLNLNNLYAYLSKQLIEANISGDNDKIRDSLRVVEPLLEAWTEIAKKPQKVKSQTPGEALELPNDDLKAEQAALNYG